jgi:hypothetical protein
MMSVLDVLRYRLGGGKSEDPLDPGAFTATPRRAQLPPGLPLNVQDSILYRPSYAEGDIKAPLPYWNPALDPERHLFTGPQRSDLLNELWFNRFLKGQGASPIDRPPEQSLFANPLNQFLQMGPSAPLSMY